MDSLAVSSVDMRIVRSCLTRMCLHVWLLFAHFVIERMCDLSDKLHVNTNDYWWVSESLPLCRNIFQSAYKSFFILSNLYSLCAAFDGWVDLVGEIKKKRLCLEFTWSVQVFFQYKPRNRWYERSSAAGRPPAVYSAGWWKVQPPCVVVLNIVQEALVKTWLCVSEEWTKITEQGYSMSALMHSPGLGLPALSEPNLKKKNEKPSTFSALDPA